MLAVAAPKKAMIKGPKNAMKAMKLKRGDPTSSVGLHLDCGSAIPVPLLPKLKEGIVHKFVFGGGLAK